MCDLKREIGLRLSGRILGVQAGDRASAQRTYLGRSPFCCNRNNAVASGREQIGVNGERAKTRGAINGTAMNPIQIWDRYVQGDVHIDRNNKRTENRHHHLLRVRLSFDRSQGRRPRALFQISGGDCDFVISV